MIAWLSTFYLLAAGGISLFGLYGLVTLAFYGRHRHPPSRPAAKPPPEQWPPVTVQLPLFNERFVLPRLLEAATNLDYPTGQLQIQILDDSNDDTTEIAKRLVADYRQQGIDIELRHRCHRQGFKAGALQEALQTARGHYIAIFDADFKPDPDFLRQTIPHFLEEPRLGMIQTRWDHLNQGDSILTAVQAIAIDKHFMLEQTVRHRAYLFPKFNGSAGVWRRSCLESAGGWEADTVCEDLCLSTRAVLQGWQTRLLTHVTARAEIPNSMTAFKNQQARWAKGAIQCLLKFGPAILTNPRQSWSARLYALAAMLVYGSHLLVILLLLLQVPLIYFNYPFPPLLLLFGLFGLGQPILFIMSQQILYPDWWRRLRHLPLLLFIAIGLAPSGARAVLQALLGEQNHFVRTPKGIGPATSLPDSLRRRYRESFDAIVLIELLLALYAALGIAIALRRGSYSPILFLATCLIGLSYVALNSLKN